MKLRLQITTGPGTSTTFEHAGPVVCIGRDAGCELALRGGANTMVSRQHAQIELTPTGATLSRLSRSNATLLNDRLIEAKAPLHPGDRIQLGHTGPTLTVLEVDLAPPADTPPPAGSRRSAGLLAVGVAASVVLIGVVLLVRANRTKPPDDPPGITEADPLPPRPPPPLPPPPPPPPVEVGPSLEVKRVGEYIVPKNGGPSVLLQRFGEAYPWVALVRGSPVHTAQTLVSLPGYRSLIVLDSGVHLTLWGNLPELAPPPVLLESVGMLTVPEAGIDLDLTLDRGRIHLANRKPSGAARVRLRFQREVWELTLPEPQSQVVADLWIDLPRPETVGKPALLQLKLHARGQVQVLAGAGRQTLHLPDRTALHWRSQGGAVPSQETLSKLPDWWTRGPDRTAPQVKDVMVALNTWGEVLAGSSEVIDTIRSRVTNWNDPRDREVGVLFLGALDGLQPLLTFLENNPHPEVRGSAAFALQVWLNRAGHHADDLARLLNERKYAQEKIDLLRKLLGGYSHAELDQPRTYQNLIAHLNHDDLMVRDLAYRHLWHRIDGAAKIDYNPTWKEPERRRAVAQWKKLVPSNEVPPPPKPSSGAK